MNILLVGEYSRLHNSLKEGLEALGHKVTLVASGDYFKNFPADIKIHRNYDQGLSKKVKVGLYKLFKIDITSIDIKQQLFRHKKELIDYDVVQLINESPWAIQAKQEQSIFDFLSRYNKSIFLLCCGSDYTSVNFANQKRFRYSIMTPYFEGRIKQKTFESVLKYLKPEFKALHHHIFKNVKGVIASDLDYHLPMLEQKNYLGLIPNPINVDKLDYIDLKIDTKVIIFHGINERNYHKKGNDIFEAALTMVQQKFSEKIEVITARSLPYSEYIKFYDSAHIVLDQVYAYDQGYNALEAMAKGKVVFTGAEQEWLDFYHLKEDTVAINALPDAEKIAKKLEWLILNPHKLMEISKNARMFIEREHHYIKIAEKYLTAWLSRS